MAKRKARKRLKTRKRLEPVEISTPPDLSMVNKSFNSLYSTVNISRVDEAKTVKFADDLQQPLIYLKYYTLENSKGQLIETGRTHDDDRTPMERAVVVNRHYSFLLLNFSRRHKNQTELQHLLEDERVVLTTLVARKDIINGTISVLLADPHCCCSHEDRPAQVRELEMPKRWSVSVHYTYNNWSSVTKIEARLVKHHMRSKVARYEFYLKLDPCQVQLETCDLLALYVGVDYSEGMLHFMDNNAGLYYLAKIHVDE